MIRSLAQDEDQDDDNWQDNHLNALLTSFQFVFIAFSALLIMLLASLSSCWDENLATNVNYCVVPHSSHLEFLET